MWLGYPGTSGASFIDYIITDRVTSPIDVCEQYSEKLAYMPNTFFIGDHANMFPHLVTKVLLDIPDIDIDGRENICMINGAGANTLLEGHTSKSLSLSSDSDESLPILDQAVSSHIHNLVQASQTHITINGCVVQNGLTTNQV